MNEKSLYDLYTAVSATLDVGTYEEYKQRMLDKNNRKKLYDMAKPDFDETWGFSVRSLKHQLKLLA